MWRRSVPTGGAGAEVGVELFAGPEDEGGVFDEGQQGRDGGKEKVVPGH